MEIRFNSIGYGYMILNLQGKYEHKKWDKADSLILNKTVLGGGGGDIEGAFPVKNACTLVWSNTHSWVRPRTVKFVVEVYAVTE
jgi:hypothetical protein